MFSNQAGWAPAPALDATTSQRSARFEALDAESDDVSGNQPSTVWRLTPDLAPMVSS